MEESGWLTRPEWGDVPPLSLVDTSGAPITRLVVIVAHPDDETLAAGGLIHAARQRGVDIVVLFLTDGEASHPDSPTHTPVRLAQRRRQECRAALDQLGESIELRQAGLPDGCLAEHHGEVRTAVEALLDEARGDPHQALMVVSTWREDGHPDHEVVGEVVGEACGARRLRHLEAPIWLWAWRGPQEAPWHRMVRLELSSADRAAKHAAMEAYVSQLHPLSDQVGDGAIVSADVAEHFRRPWETFLETVPPARAAVFDRMYAGSEDPWAFEGSWYEERKRAITLASLPTRDLGRVLEVGPATGLLTQALAARSDHVLAVDISAEALARVERRLSEHPARDRVELVVADVATEFPQGVFDTIIISEVGYFLTESEWLATLDRARQSLAHTGSLVLVHWRHEVVGWPIDGDDVHSHAETCESLQLTVHHVEEDFILQVHRPPGLPSIAQGEGR